LKIDPCLARAALAGNTATRPTACGIATHGRKSAPDARERDGTGAPNVSDVCNLFTADLDPVPSDHQIASRWGRQWRAANKT